MNRSVDPVAYRAARRLLREARESDGLTQTEVAKRLKKPQSFVAKYESGERRLDIIEFIAISDALRIEPTRLFAQMLRAVRNTQRST